MESPTEKGAPVVHALPITDAARIRLLLPGLGSPKETETRRDERARRRQKVTELRNRGDDRAQQSSPGTGPAG